MQFDSWLLLYLKNIQIKMESANPVADTLNAGANAANAFVATDKHLGSPVGKVSRAAVAAVESGVESAKNAAVEFDKNFTEGVKNSAYYNSGHNI